MPTSVFFNSLSFSFLFSFKRKCLNNISSAMITCIKKSTVLSFELSFRHDASFLHSYDGRQTLTFKWKSVKCVYPFSLCHGQAATHGQSLKGSPIVSIQSLLSLRPFSLANLPTINWEGFMLFSRHESLELGLTRSENQTNLSRFCTRVVEFISCHDNRCTSLKVWSKVGVMVNKFWIKLRFFSSVNILKVTSVEAKKRSKA